MDANMQINMHSTFLVSADCQSFSFILLDLIYILDAHGHP